MNEEFRGVVNRTAQQSVPWWPAPNVPAESSPNVVVVLLDDAGFAHFGCYGAPIETPTFDQLAGNGLRFTNFTVAAVCSPTRVRRCLTGTQPSLGGYALRREFRHGISEHARRATEASGDDGSRPARCRVRDLRRRQVAHRARSRVLGGGTLSQLAAGTGIRALLRLSRRRDRSVPSRTGLRQSPRRAPASRRRRLSPHRRSGRPGNRDDPRSSLDRARAALLSLPRDGCDTRAASVARDIPAQVSRTVRRRLGRAS